MGKFLGSILLAMVIQVAISKWVNFNVLDWQWWLSVFPVCVLISLIIQFLLSSGN